MYSQIEDIPKSNSDKYKDGIVYSYSKLKGKWKKRFAEFKLGLLTIYKDKDVFSIFMNQYRKNKRQRDHSL